ncbi:MAG: His/Gly/Thr/Pro-type tRNA ligase C-terminal domain-containing protein [Firmicutes bacterium]|nr:His/Gly/Thr/Pro-type tRNA ligase C-terminal domain-containing protein [Bacillota bacterium]
MKLSKLNIKKIKFNAIDKNYSGEDLLMKIGELYQFESGIFGYGNIWTKLEKIVENVIIEELEKADCIEVEFPKLQPKKIWEQSNRWDIYTGKSDIMFSIKNNLGEYGLAPTAEECATIFGANRLLSYKNLPTTYFQIGEKFRKEIRARGYLFRPRTFVMMDAYSFDRTKEEMHENFNKMHNVYENIFKRLGINIVSVISDGGTMGGKVSEEFQAITSLGEDVILYDEEKNIGINKEVLGLNDESYINGIDLSKMKEVKAIELGNNFELGTKYSESMQLFYTDENGQNKPYYMGCYGIGLGRIIALIIENNAIIKNNEFKGFVLPYNISHYKVQIIYNENNKEKAFELYNELLENNINAIIDDRENINIGARINDVYAIGTPKIIVLANKFNGLEYEVEDSKTNEITKIECTKIIEYFNNL